MNQLDAQHYNEHSTFQKTVADGLLSQHRFRGDETILDIGCGDGVITAKISQWAVGGQTKGIDPSSQMVSFARKNYPSSQFTNLAFETGRAEDSHGLDCYDLITAFNCLHWVSDVPRAFDAVYKALKPGGRFISAAYPGNSPYWQLFIEVLQRKEWQHIYFHAACQHWLNAEAYKTMIETSAFQATLYNETTEQANYSDKKELTDYIKGWLACLAPFSNAIEAKDFLGQVVDEAWLHYADHKDGHCSIPYIKLEMILEKQ